MKTLSLLALTLGLASTSAIASECAEVFNTEYPKLHSNKTIDMCAETAGKAVLVVNTASHCGFTPQFKELQAVYSQYKDKGLTVVGFPSDDFFQEDDDQAKTAEVCYINYGVKFAMTQPVAVRGSDAIPLFKNLADQADDAPNWNFHKYLVDQNGKVIGSWGSRTKPDSDEIISAIENTIAMP
ncbi:glutathione peroxidase [Paraferrimonas sedimenticola]|uniref:Glutathione peroxidase n=1 Tax=Paraferrimonas sedimenticola TaxID=375674 RepID=A0AA37RVD2_9GAMM|nr:glutathione peroxidase [Paraferrimonas sedimenticola]GLP95522.1 glutathione peroxidase [Paraferrimonas sedimenticola]